MVTKEMIGAAHDICLKKGDFVLSANLLERIYLAMRDKAGERDSAGWDAYEDLRKASDEMVLDLRQRVQELTAERDSAYKIADHYRAERDALKQQRDYLMAALEYSATQLDDLIDTRLIGEAIASVKEKQNAAD